MSQEILQNRQLNQDSLTFRAWLQIKPFFFGGFSGVIAQYLTQPIDTVKVRQQCISEANAIGQGRIQSTKAWDVTKLVMKTEGIRGLYQGIGAAIMRQIIQTTVRLGTYNKISDSYKMQKQRNLTLLEKSVLSSVTGWCGVLIGNWTDVIVVRFQADTLLPLNQRRRYKNFVDAFFRLIKEEGILSLWRGCFPTVVRAGLVNMGMVAPYEEIKERVNQWTGTSDTLNTRLIASAIAGCISATISMPADNAKTKLQRMKPDQNGKFPYNGFFDCLYKTCKYEGVFKLWIGLGTFMLRVAPYTMVALVMQDFFFYLCKQYNV